MTTSIKSPALQKIIAWGTAALVILLALVPFHAFLTVWAGSSFGGYTAWRLWPEILLVVLLAGSVLVVLPDRQLLSALFRDRLRWLMAAYCVVLTVWGLAGFALHHTNKAAFGEGLVEDVRLPLFFIVAQIFAARSDCIRRHWRKIVVIPAAVVVVFGLLQVFVLPVDFLRHFGYGPHTIAPYETVDQKLAYVRAQSSLRGPNPLGAYLVIAVTALFGVGFRKRATWAKTLLAIDAMATLIVLGYTYSRSAYIGAVVALATFAWWSINSARLKRLVLLAAAVVVLLGTGAFALLRHNDRFENTFFHTDQHSVSQESSNQARGSALENGVRDVVHEPLGRGVGTAGPASAHNLQPARISENYFLQIGQETGWLGLALFLAINAVLAVRLWHDRAEPLHRALLASLLGITIINLLSHAWTDDTLAIVWWTLAGVALAPQHSSPSPKKERPRPLHHKYVVQFAKYMAGGGLYFWSGYGIFAFCYSGLHWNWLPAKMAADAVGWTLNYLVQRYWAFAAEGKKLSEIEHIARYITIESAGFVLDYVLIAWLRHFGITPYVGFFISAGFFTVWSYLWYRYWVFPEKGTQRQKDSAAGA